MGKFLRSALLAVPFVCTVGLFALCAYLGKTKLLVILSVCVVLGGIVTTRLVWDALE